MPSFIGFSRLWNRFIDGLIPLDGDDNAWDVIVHGVEDLLYMQSQVWHMLDLNVPCAPKDMVYHSITIRLWISPLAVHACMRFWTGIQWVYYDVFSPCNIYQLHGFTKKPTVAFNDDASRPLATASTRDLVLLLLVSHQNYQFFKSNMVLSMH